MFEKYNKQSDEDTLTIFEYCSDAREYNSYVALFNNDNILIDDNVEPSDYIDMLLNHFKEVIEPSEYEGYYIILHKGDISKNLNIKKIAGFNSKC